MASVWLIALDRDMGFLYRHALETAGHEVLELDGVPVADDVWRRPPSHAVIDLGAPDDDLGALRAIRRRDPGEAMRVIALTGYLSVAYRSRVMAAGCDELLLKPVEAETILAVVERPPEN